MDRIKSWLKEHPSITMLDPETYSLTNPSRLCGVSLLANFEYVKEAKPKISSQLTMPFNYQNKVYLCLPITMGMPSLNYRCHNHVPIVCWNPINNSSHQRPGQCNFQIYLKDHDDFQLLMSHITDEHMNIIAKPISHGRVSNQLQLHREKILHMNFTNIFLMQYPTLLEITTSKSYLFHCSFCDYTCETTKSLKRHLVNHVKIVIVPCFKNMLNSWQIYLNK